MKCNTSAGQSFIVTTESFRTAPFSQIPLEYGDSITKWAALWSGFAQLFMDMFYPILAENYSSVEFGLNSEGINLTKE